MDLIFLIIIFIYGLTLLIIVFGIEIIEFNKITAIGKNQKFTIIVVYRDENHHLPNLLKSFQRLNYHKEDFEILMINDGSSEDFDFTSFDLPIKIFDNIRYSKSPKKDGITLAVNHAKYHWMVLTDADCEVPKNWLYKLNQYINKNSHLEMVCGSVFIKINHSFLTHFQAWDFISLQAITIGSFGLQRAFMCNGANMAFTKTIFNQVGGYQSSNHLKSGDDVFLLQDVLKNDKLKVGYLFDSEFFVKTSAMNDWHALINQRIRWGSKASSYQSFFGKYLSFLVLVVSLFFLINFIKLDYKLVISKLLIDILFLCYFSNKIKQKPDYFFLSLLLYPFFIIEIIFKSIFTDFNWKK